MREVLRGSLDCVVVVAAAAVDLAVVDAVAVDCGVLLLLRRKTKEIFIDVRY